MPRFLRLDSTITTLGLAALMALGVSASVSYLPGGITSFLPTPASATSPKKGNGQGAGETPRWAASAPGRVKPRGGEISVRPEAAGVVTAVYASINDVVRKGDPIALMKDEDMIARLAAARAEVDVRVAERDEEKENNKLMKDWRKALDELSAAERALHAARVLYDRLYVARRKGRATDRQVNSARRAIRVVKARIVQHREEVREAAAKEDLPPATRLDSGLAIARSDLKLAELAFDRTRIRASANGTILQLDVKSGETTGPTSAVPVALIGDMARLQVTAEIEERDIRKIGKGQEVVVRSKAYPDKEFSGKVTRLAPRVATPGLGVRGKNKPRDVEILEVEIDLDGTPPLLSGMRVDVFFSSKGATQAAARN